MFFRVTVPKLQFQKSVTKLKKTKNMAMAKAVGLTKITQNERGDYILWNPSPFLLKEMLRMLKLEYVHLRQGSKAKADTDLFFKYLERQTEKAAQQETQSVG